MSDDCTRRTQCVSRNGESIFVTSSVNMKCHPNGMCGLEKGIRKCVCAEGFEGDGIRQCKSKMRSTDFQGSVSSHKPYFDLQWFPFTNFEIDGELYHWHVYHIYYIYVYLLLIILSI